MSYNINVDDWYDDAITLKAKGFSTRKIAVALFNNENYRNRLNIFYKQDTVIEDVEKRAKELENEARLDDFIESVEATTKPTFSDSCKTLANAMSSFGKAVGEGFKQVNKVTQSKPKLLFYDIETSLAKSYHFSQWKVNLSQKQKIQESHLLSHAWAWGEGEVTGSILTREEMLAHDPERLVLECWSLLDNCDVLIAHNGKRFDVRKVNSYFLQYGLPPPSPYRVIDTLLIAKQKFALPFNSLAYLAEFLNVEQKIDTGGVDLWIQCDQGSQEALDKMNEYCMGDIVTLRSVYNHLISWSNDGVNLALYSDHGTSCPHCSSYNVSVIEGKYAHTVARKYQVYRCNDCGAVLRSNKMQGKGNSLVRVV